MAAREAMTFLQLICQCDDFPYPGEDEYQRKLESLYSFRLRDAWLPAPGPTRCVGYMLPEVVKAMPWTEEFFIDHAARVVTIPYFNGHESAAIKRVLERARGQNIFKVLSGWRNELYSIIGLNRLVTIERAGSALFGLHTIGVHLTAFYRTIDGELMIWVPRRSRRKQTYGGMLDNSVAGGIAVGEDPFDCIVREAGEEASLDPELVRAAAKPVGTVSYFHMRDSRAGGETGLLQPETQYVYDLELEPDVVLSPSDDEVEGFGRLNVEKVKQALLDEQFKPNCALCLIDFLIRHGEITAGNEPSYLKILPRMHRRIEFNDVFSRLKS